MKLSWERVVVAVLSAVLLTAVGCPPQQKKEIVRENTKSNLVIDIQKAHLPAYQMIGYPAVVAPYPIINEVCVKPEKY